MIKNQLINTNIGKVTVRDRLLPMSSNFGQHPPHALFLGDEDIFQKSARVVALLLQFMVQPREPIFELHL